jgi:DnaD/phage-associated family protein
MEAKAEYNTGDLEDALDMLGEGYNHPSLEIHPPGEFISRRNGRLGTEKIPAFVKISTGFKKEMAGIDEISLKVWLFIALSVNRDTGKAFPGLRTIATGTGFSVNTIRAAIERLETKYALLVVDRETKRYNIYEPLDFVSANRTPIYGVSPADTVVETVSLGDETVSPKPQTVSLETQTVLKCRVNDSLNQRNQRNQIKPEVVAMNSKIFTTYEKEIRPITPGIANSIGVWIDDPKIPDQWILDAIMEASTRGVRNWAYCDSILQRWATEGRKNGKVMNKQAELLKQLEEA